MGGGKLPGHSGCAGETGRGEGESPFSPSFSRRCPLGRADVSYPRGLAAACCFALSLEAVEAASIFRQTHSDLST